MFFSYFAATVLAVTATTEAQTIVLDDTQRAQWCKTIEEVVIPDMEQGEEQQRIRLLNLYTDNKKLSRVRVDHELEYFAELTRSRAEFQRLFKERCGIRK